jgi:hypothetical protein
MPLDDFFELKDNQIYNGKPILNVYHLKKVDGGTNALVVAQAFLDWILADQLVTAQPDGLTRTTVEVENLGLVTDFASLSSSAFPGDLIAQALPSFNTATIQFNRTRTDMKNGMKRWLVGTEEEQEDGSWVSGMITALDLIATQVITPWEEDTNPGVEACEFVVLKRFCVDPEQDPCQVYRLPDTDAEVDANHYVPISFVSRTRVRSQVSRKVLI